MPLKARLFISTVICLGFALVGFEMNRWHSIDVPRFVCFGVLSVTAAILKVHLPGITGTMSVNFVFILIGTIDLSLPETLMMGCARDIDPGAVARYKTVPARASPFQRGKHGGGDQDL